MKLEYVFEDNTRARDLPLKKSEIKKLFSQLNKLLKKEPEYLKALDTMKVEELGMVGLVVCQDQLMRDLQRRHRNLDRTTDVLSFPSLELAGVAEIFYKLPVEERSWGDIVLSLETIERGAKRARRSFKNEMKDVLIHGFLHLLGFDHVQVSPAKARRMKTLQRKLFLAL